MNNGHKHYGKIKRLGSEEVEGILNGTCVIQEKVDGANTSIWLDTEGNFKMGSRTRILKDDEEFNGFVPYVKSHIGVHNLLAARPNFRLFGEWLVRHTIRYKETAYKKFYLFDIWDDEHQCYVSPDEVRNWAEVFQIDIVPQYDVVQKPTIEYLQEFVGKTQFGDRGEGIVIKNYKYINSFGDLTFAKLVEHSFLEDNAVAFGGNNKYSETYSETYVINKYMTLPRVKKIMDKLQPEINERLDLKHIPRICNTAYHDMLTEEIWAIQNDVKSLDLKALKRIGFKKAKQIYVDMLNEDINVHDQVK